MRAVQRRRNLDLIRNRMELRARSNPFELPDERFIELFRLDKRLVYRLFLVCTYLMLNWLYFYFRLVQNLIDLITPYLGNRLSQKGVPNETKIFCALRFFATGSYQRCVGQDFSLGLSQSTVHRCIKQVTRVLANLSVGLIQLPNTVAERNALKFEFMNRWGFPGCIGVVDGTHISILKPKEDEHNFINRKGFHSINVQIICDHLLKIRSLYANFGGSTHDSYIWRRCEAKMFVNNLYNSNESSWFIGDAGYPLQPFLLTPFRIAENQSQQNYNNAHCRARNCVERCIGLLKTRFRCLLKERSQRYDKNFVCLIIKACVVLHNMCVEANIPFIEEFEDEGNIEGNIDNVPFPLQNENVMLGIQKRNDIVNRYFT